MREVLGGERHQDRAKAERDGRRRPVSGLDAVAGPAHQEQQEDRRDHRAEQRERPHHRRLVLDLGLDAHRPVRVEAVVHDLRVGAPRRRPPRVRGVACGVGRVPRHRPGAGGVEGHVLGQGEQREPRRLHGIEVAVGPGLVLRLPVPAIDVRLAVGQRSHLCEVGQLRPAHRVHDEPPRDPEAGDRGEAWPGAHRLRHPAYATHGRESVGGLSGSGTGPSSRAGERARSTTSNVVSRKRTKERRDQWLRCPGVLPSELQVLEACHVEAAPEGLARDADDRPRRRERGHDRKRPLPDRAGAP